MRRGFWDFVFNCNTGMRAQLWLGCAIHCFTRACQTSPLSARTRPLRRKAREQKAYSKQVQAQKTKERTAEKKRQIEAVSNLRKQRQKSVRVRCMCAFGMCV